MAATKFLARDLTIEVQTNPVGPVFTPIGGLNSLTHSPSTERADTTDFDSGGRPEHIVAQRGESWTLSGYAMEDVADGTRDAGQAAVETLGNATGTAAVGVFRLTSPGGNTREFNASVEVGLAGGGHNEAAAWTATLEVIGAPTIA